MPNYEILLPKRTIWIAKHAFRLSKDLKSPFVYLEVGENSIYLKPLDETLASYTARKGTIKKLNMRDGNYTLSLPFNVVGKGIFPLEETTLDGLECFKVSSKKS